MPGPGFVVATVLVIPIFTTMIARFDWRLGLGIGIALFALINIVAATASPVIEVRNGRLTAGRASIEVRLTGEPRLLGAEEARSVVHERADARAYLCLRGGLPVLQIPITDPADPTPYWIVSTRHPERLLEALHRARAQSASPEAHSRQIGPSGPM